MSTLGKILLTVLVIVIVAALIGLWLLYSLMAGMADLPIPTPLTPYPTSTRIPPSPLACSFSNGGHLNVRQIVKWDTQKNDVLEIAISSDARLVAAATMNGKILLWDINSQQQLPALEGHAERVWDLAFSTDGTTLFSIAADKTLREWDLRTARVQRTIRRPSGSSLTYLSSNGRYSAYRYSSKIEVWDSADDQVIFSFDGFPSNEHAIAFDDTRLRIAAGSDDGEIRIWDLNTNELLFTLHGYSRRVEHIAFSFDGMKLVSVSNDGPTKLWDLVSGELLYTVTGTDYSSHATFSRDGTLLAVGTASGETEIVDVKQGCILATIPTSGRRLQFSPNSQTLAIGSYFQVSVWELNRQP